MATNIGVTLNPGVGGATVAFVQDGANQGHQRILMETQSGTADPVPVGSGNPLPVVFNSAQQTVGNVPSGSADSGNGVKISGVFNSVVPSFSAGQRVDAQMDINGNLKVNIVAGAAAGGTSSNFGSSFPGSGTAIGFLNNAGTNLQAGSLDASGNLKVNIAAGSVQAVTDNSSVFSSGSTQALAIAAVFNDSVGTLTSGTLGVPRLTANRQLRVVQDASPNGGLTYFNLLAPATPAKSAVKASAGQIGFLHVVNLSATLVYVKVFDLASASVTLGTTAASFQFAVPASTTGAGFTVAIPQGLSLLTALTVAVTGGISLTDNTAISANSVNLAMGYA